MTKRSPSFRDVRTRARPPKRACLATGRARSDRRHDRLLSDGETLRNWVRQTERVDMAFALTAAVCHLIRLLKLLAKSVVA